MSRKRTFERPCSNEEIVRRMKNGGEVLILLLRVDHRLLHGQTAISWVGNLGADCVLVADDEAATDELQVTMLRLAKPQGVKLVIKTIDDSIAALNEGVTDKYKLFIVTGSVAGAKRLADGCPQITQVNLGGVKPKPDTKNISKAVFLLQKEIEMLKELVARGVEVESRLIPKDKKMLFSDAVIS